MAPALYRLDGSGMSEIEEKVRAVLAETPHLYLSTSRSDNPWVAGGFFAESDPFTLVMVLESHGTTLSNIRENSRVAVVVSGGNAFAPFLQGRAQAVIRDGDELEDVKNALRAKVPEIEPLFQAPIEPVLLRVERWRVTDIATGWFPGKEIEAPTPSG